MESKQSFNLQSSPGNPQIQEVGCATRYLSDDVQVGALVETGRWRLIGLQSTHGTGKTVCAQQGLRHYQQLVVMAHLRSLVSGLARDFDVVDYRSVVGGRAPSARERARRIATEPRVALCAHGHAWCAS
jgi:hypothetical protein